MTLTQERAELLGELLAELAEDPKGFIPQEAWAAAQQAFALPYIELCIVRRNDEGKLQILLTHRTDTDWNGWHIPGGLWRTRDTLEEGITKLAKVELGGDYGVTLLAQGEWEKWHDHPYGRPVSHIVICSGENIPETDDRKWFESVPENMIVDHGHHARFIANALKQAETLV